MACLGRGCKVAPTFLFKKSNVFSFTGFFLEKSRISSPEEEEDWEDGVQ